MAWRKLSDEEQEKASQVRDQERRVPLGGTATPPVTAAPTAPRPPRRTGRPQERPRWEL